MRGFSRLQTRRISSRRRSNYDDSVADPKRCAMCEGKMKPYAKEFYQSTRWKAMRSTIWNRDNGLCQMCGQPGREVHHIQEIAPDNIHDSNVTLNPDNLVLLCKSCHRKVTEKKEPVRGGCAFDSDGYVIEYAPIFK